MKIIPYGKQYIDEDDVRAVVDVLKSDWLTQGPLVKEFEDSISRYCGARYAVAVSSGTAALHIACLAAGLDTGDEAIVPTNTFVASANCAAYCGAAPVFADIDNKTFNLSPKTLAPKVTDKTRAVIPVHFAGQSCDMGPILNIVKSAEKRYGHKIFIIEDACHALGSLYKQEKVGSCFYSDMTVMSFHPVKHITTAEGGVVLTNNNKLYQRLNRLRTHGITNDVTDFDYPEEAFHPGPSSGKSERNPWYYEQHMLGYNYRITDIQCALGLSQLEKLNRFRLRRKEIVEKYNHAFDNKSSIRIPFEPDYNDTNFHLYVLLFDWQKIGLNRAQFMNGLKRRGVLTQVHYIPVHTQPYYQKKFNTRWGDCSDAEDYYKKCLSIPLFPGMTDNDIDKVIIAITETAGYQ